MEEQHPDSAHTATPPPIVLGRPHDEPVSSTSPSPAPSSASSQAAAHPAEHPQASSATSADYQARTAPFAQHDFPVLTSAPAAQPGIGTKDDLDLQYPASTDVHMLDGRATYFLPNERSSTATSSLAPSLHMTTASGGAASLAQHGADRFQQPTYSWYDPGAPQNPLGQHAQPRSAPAEQPSFTTGHLGSNGTQDERRTLEQVMGDARVGDSGGGEDGHAQPAASGPRTPEMDRAVAMAGRKRARDEQPDIVVDPSSSAAALAPNHIAVGVSVRLSSGEMNDASSATTDDEAVEVQQREAQRRRTESNAQQQQLQQQALAYAQSQQQYALQQQHQLYYQQQQQQRAGFSAYGPGMQGVAAAQQAGPGAAARTSSAQPYPSAPPPYGQQSYQGAYSGYTGYTVQWPAQSGEASSSASSSSTTSPPLGNAHPGPQRFSYYPPATQSYYAQPYAPSTSSSHPAYSPSTAITSPSVQATPGPSDRRMSAPPAHQPFGAAPPPQQQQQQQQQGVDQKQAFGAASSAQGAQAAAEPEDKPVRRRVQVDNPFVIPTAQGVKPFVNKLRFLMRNADKVGDVICWDESGKVVLVHVMNKRLEGEVLPRTFGHAKFDSLRNQFRSYGFVALKEPGLSRALNPHASSSSSTAAADPASTSVASTSAAPSSSPDELRDVREWKAFLHVHSAADFAAMRAEERERDALFRRIAREKEAAKRTKAAEKDNGDGAQPVQQVEMSKSEGEDDSEEEDDDDEPWFSRDEIDNLRLLRRLRPKAAKHKGKVGAGGAAASGSGASGGGGGGGGAARTTTGSNSAGSSTALGSSIAQSQQQQLQYIAPRATSTQAPSSTSTSTSTAQFAPRPAVPASSSGLAVPPFKSMPSLVPPPHVQAQAQAQAPAQGEARGAGSAERVDVGSLVGLRRSSGAGALG